MDRIEPDFTERIDFTFTDLFDSEDPLALWVMNLARGANDLLLGNRRLVNDFDSPPSGDATPPRHDVIYDVKAVASDAWELAKFIRRYRDSPEITEFIDRRMPKKARQDLEGALAAFEASDRDPPETKNFKALLASARDQDSHYSEIDHKLMKRALRNLATDFEGRPNETSLLKGERFKDFYAPFGSEMDWQLFHQMAGGNLESLKPFVGKLNEVVGQLIRFSETAIDCWFRDHENVTSRVELPDRDD